MKFNLIESVDDNSRDNLDNPLTPQQMDYFADSKVRDSKGNLIVCYHGTGSNFSVFRKGDIGFHFGTKAQAKVRADIWGKKGNVNAYYLNIKNPLVIDYDYGSWDGEFLASRFIRDEIATTPEDIKILKDIEQNMYGGEYNSPASKALRNWVKSRGYDGIMYLNTFETKQNLYSYIVFEPNQIKSINNKYPSDNNNINESLSENFSIDDEYFSAVELGDMEKAQALVIKTAKERGYDTEGKIEYDVFEGSPNRSYRGVQRKVNPVSDWGHMMFVDNSEQAYWSDDLDLIQDTLYSVDINHLTPITELSDTIKETLRIDYENEELPDYLQAYIDENGEYGIDNIVAQFNPEDIVDSAQAYDSEEMLMWFSERIADAYDIKGVKTYDGAVVFGKIGIVQRVADTRPVIEDKWGNIISPSKRFDDNIKNVKY